MRSMWIAAVVLFAVGCGFSKKKPPAYVAVSLDQLSDEWAVNPSAASAKYQDNGVVFSGILREISSNIHGQTHIDVRASAESKRGTHIFVLTSQAKSGLNKCAVGKPVLVRARSDASAHREPSLIADDIEPKE